MRYALLAMAAALALAGQSVRTMSHLPDTGQTRHFAAGEKRVETYQRGQGGRPRGERERP